MAKWTGWEHELLGALGVPATKARIDFLAAWQKCEGGGARFNPLNTTESVPGSTRYNSVGVQNYQDRYSGIAATLLTLRLPYYADLLKALNARGIRSLEIARRSEKALRTWGTGSACIERLLS